MADINRPIVTVEQGQLQGIVEQGVLGSRYVSFKSIPFAAPPVGELRFKDPTPPIPWEGIRDASKDCDISAQIMPLPTPHVIGSEDCLYLNIYIPYNLYQTKEIPVMVWIHGGAFIYGSRINQRCDYLIEKNVIVVSISYRLGAFGFLNLGHESVNGNQALKDQVLALKWIKRNIEAFGGNPNNITVFGVSAGSGSIHLLMLSPVSKGLFHKAILESGLATCDWNLLSTVKANSFKLASILGSTSTNPEEIIQYLQTISTAKIIEAQSQILDPLETRTRNVPFVPVIDDVSNTPFFPNPLSQSIIENDNNIPIIVGYTSDEYIYFLKDTRDETLGVLYEDLPVLVRNYLNSQDTVEITRLTEQIKRKYFNNEPFTKENIPSIIRFLSDVHFIVPIKNFVDQRRKRQQTPSTYLYKFSYVGNQETETMFIPVTGTQLTGIGASHTDELSYLFYLPYNKIKDPEPPAPGTNDRKMLEILTRMWSNFAKTGNPTPALDEYVTTTWLPATADSFNYLNIDNTSQLSTTTFTAGENALRQITQEQSEEQSKEQSEEQEKTRNL